MLAFHVSLSKHETFSELLLMGCWAYNEMQSFHLHSYADKKYVSFLEEFGKTLDVDVQLRVGSDEHVTGNGIRFRVYDLGLGFWVLGLGL